VLKQDGAGGRHGEFANLESLYDAGIEQSALVEDRQGA
jgi:hypothetical protein